MEGRPLEQKVQRVGEAQAGARVNSGLRYPEKKGGESDPQGYFCSTLTSFLLFLRVLKESVVEDDVW